MFSVESIDSRAMRLSTRPHDWREFGAKKAHWLGKVIRSQRRAFAVSGTGYFSRPRPLSHILGAELSPAPLSSNVVKRVNL
jgi:hypothetical protein